jgi:NAD-dependent dihydropyrimidine dehydrogenase PreA subunit
LHIYRHGQRRLSYLRKLIADPRKCTGRGVCEETCSKAYFKVFAGG